MRNRYTLGFAAMLLVVFFAVGKTVHAFGETLLSVLIGNVAPTVSNVRVCADPMAGEGCAHEGLITPFVGTDRTLFIFADVSDLNGADDVSTVKLDFYRQSLTSTCTNDANFCYRAIVCQLDANLTSSTSRYICPLNIKYWIDPTTNTADDFPGDHWRAKVTVIDTSGASASSENVSDCGEVLALSGFPVSLDYGSHRLGEETTGETSVKISVVQAGNVDADMEIKSDSDVMVCGGPGGYGTIPISNQRFQGYDVTPVGYAESLHSLTTEFQNLGLNDGPVLVAGETAVRRRVNDAGFASSGKAAFNISIPVIGVAGVCQSYVTITTIKKSVPGNGR
jgi:hypothetical protein